jgi:hypothetical protein
VEDNKAMAAVAKTCASASRPATNYSSTGLRLALALRGGVFRAGFSKAQNRCSNDSYEVQKAIYKSFDAHIIRAFEARGWTVDVYIMTFPCSKNNQANQHYMEDLRTWFKPKVFDMWEPSVADVGIQYMTNQGRYTEGVLRSVAQGAEEYGAYDYVINVRIDQTFREDYFSWITAWGSSLQEQDRIAASNGEHVSYHAKPKRKPTTPFIKVHVMQEAYVSANYPGKLSKLLVHAR